MGEGMNETQKRIFAFLIIPTIVIVVFGTWLLSWEVSRDVLSTEKLVLVLVLIYIFVVANISLQWSRWKRAKKWKSKEDETNKNP